VVKCLDSARIQQASVRSGGQDEEPFMSAEG